LDDEYPRFTFGQNKEGELFVNAQKTGIMLDESVTYEALEKKLLKNKLIKVIIEEEE
jgi:hypothetical protein